LAQLINNHLDKLDKLEEVVVENADNILPSINVDDLLKNPENYLLALGDAFLKEHIGEIEQAADAGKAFADNILKSL
tara:strand:- start:204 stop:434 length:231 start_codon:yes stop_codon:yes gene_type:complete